MRGPGEVDRRSGEVELRQSQQWPSQNCLTLRQLTPASQPSCQPVRQAHSLNVLMLKGVAKTLFS